MIQGFLINVSQCSSLQVSKKRYCIIYGCSVQHPTPVNMPCSLGMTSYKIASPPNTEERRVVIDSLSEPSRLGRYELTVGKFLRAQGTERSMSKEARVVGSGVELILHINKRKMYRY